MVTGLEIGGAEVMLANVLAHIDRHTTQATVISLTDEGPVSEKIRSLGIPLYSLGMRRGMPNPLAVMRLARLLRSLQPEIVQTWMYHADLIGGLAARLAGIRAIVWGVHNADLDPKRVKRTTLWTVLMCARLSRVIPRKICFVSEEAIAIHGRQGYDVARCVFVPNGFDTAVYRASPEDRVAVRREWKIAPDVPVIGMIARFDPQKDHENFAQAAGLLHQRLPQVRFLLCGPGITPENQTLVQWLERNSVGHAALLLGPRNDIPRLLNALDLATLSSRYGESFPMSIGEAMATGVPAVVTDVGGAGYLVGETGRVVKPGDPSALAAAWEEILNLSPSERATVAAEARERVVRYFDIRSIAARYQDIQESTLF